MSEPSKKVLRALLNWFMVSDPWPLDDQEHRLVKDWLDQQSHALDYGDWIEAYHDELQKLEGDDA